MTDRIGGSTQKGNVRSLQDAIRRMRVVTTERADGVADLQAAERARLELLAEELAEVFKSVPGDADFFAFSVSRGEPPRLWIDMTSHVAMGRDRRTYRFLKDTRLGRTVILETPVLDDMADCITDYVAERVIEREKALEGDWFAERLKRGPVSTLLPGIVPSQPDGASGVVPKRRGRLLFWLATFAVGALGGVAAIAGHAMLMRSGL